MTTAKKKFEVAALYFPTLGIESATVRPIDGKKFGLEELQEAVGGAVEMLVPAKRGVTVWANEEGLLLRLQPNPHTSTVANMRVYELNGYPPNWKAAGRLLAVHKSTTMHGASTPTVHEALNAVHAKKAVAQ